MKRDKYRRLRRTLRVEPRKEVRRARPISRSIANVSPDIQRYSYQISLRRLALKMRAMSKRLRSMETQLARGYKTLSGTKADMLSAPNVGGGILWWATDEGVLYVHDDTSWQLSKATRSGTTAERLAYTPIFTGEMWWDTTLEQLFVWNGSAWDDVAVAHSGPTVERDAYSQDAGDTWWDTTEREWYIDIGNGWQVMSPNIWDAFYRLPSLLYQFQGGTERYNIIPYDKEEDGGDPILSQFGSALALYAWARPQRAISDGWLISEWRWDSVEEEYDDTYFYSIEQYNDVFSFGVSDDGVRANRTHIETASISDITDEWHFIVGLYDPGNSIKLFHNGTWYRDTTSIPASRYFDDVAWRGTQINFRLSGKSGYPDYGSGNSPGYFDRAFCMGGVTAPSEELVEHIYNITKGFFL